LRALARRNRRFGKGPWRLRVVGGATRRMSSCAIGASWSGTIPQSNLSPGVSASTTLWPASELQRHTWRISREVH
jgi:hypothetical protein